MCSSIEEVLASAVHTSSWERAHYRTLVRPCLVVAKMAVISFFLAADEDASRVLVGLDCKVAISASMLSAGIDMGHYGVSKGRSQIGNRSLMWLLGKARALDKIWSSLILGVL